MKKLITFLTLAMISYSANAVAIQTCFNLVISPEVIHSSYTDCVNDNFESLENEIEAFMSFPCFNYNSNEVSSSYVSCVNHNFSKISSKLEDVQFRTCVNYFSDELHSSFITCVNDNFNALK
ncbi:MAG: hypothetical protein ISR65_12090 [Bacteriovoracaceae bacterium]|nr:hypothetical protein [Bacteriovoracaceae bacterium]